MPKISWTEISTNEEVWKRIGDEKSILGHVLRHDGMLLTYLERTMGK